MTSSFSNTPSAANPDLWLLPAPRRAAATPRIAAIGGDGVGPEIVASAVACLRATGADLEVVEPLHGAEAVRAGKSAFPDELKEELHRADAILFGAVDTGPSGHCRPILRYIRWGMDTYANIRPAVALPWPDSDPGEGDLVIVRELSEGEYPGREGEVAELARRWPDMVDSIGRRLPESGRFAVRLISEDACRRIGRYAAELAAHRRSLGNTSGELTIVTKANVLKHTDGLFHDVCAEEAEKVGVTVDHLYVDEAARRLVVCPEQFDVIVTSNLYGDILSDVSSEVMGGITIAPSAGIGANVAYFESCHGSAPDIAGKNVANPSATILSAAMMLGYLGQKQASARLLDAVIETIGAGVKTPDMGGEATTTSFTEAICDRLRDA